MVVGRLLPTAFRPAERCPRRIGTETWRFETPIVGLDRRTMSSQLLSNPRESPRGGLVHGAGQENVIEPRGVCAGKTASVELPSSDAAVSSSRLP